MIKVENVMVSIKGTKAEICADATILLRKLKELIGGEMYKRVIEDAEMSEEEVHKKVEKMIMDNIFGVILNCGKKQTDSREPDADIFKDLRDAMKRESEE